MTLSIPWHSTETWQPTEFVRFEMLLATSMGTGKIVTDAGRAYIKAMGNPQGPHLLAAELVATRLAKWFKLPVLDFSVIEIDADVDEIPFPKGAVAASGPAFVTRALQAHSWGGSDGELKKLVNQGDISRLVVFDTWVRNCDRYSGILPRPRVNYDNVLLEELGGSDAGQLRLIAMDHTHCFTCGADLDSRLSHIDRVKDDPLFGLFPAFVGLVRQEEVDAAVADLRQLDVSWVREIVDDIPSEWEVDSSAKKALIDLIAQRAAYVAERVGEKIAARCWPDRLFDS